jgi:phosphatidylglycerophosphate synthase
MLDTITGLPVHALVVHAVVIGLPLGAVLTVLVAVRQPWRSWLPVMVAVDAVVVGLALVARSSGQQLQARIRQFGGADVSATHGREGTWLWAFAAALTLTAALAWWAHRRGRATAAAATLVVVAAAAALGWTVVVGDSGARAVWQQTIHNTHAP